jgi:hypothetical protein
MWALDAINSFALQTGQNVSADGIEDVLGDLLTNVGHLADRNNINLGLLIIDSARVYLEETDGSGPQFASIGGSRA